MNKTLYAKKGGYMKVVYAIISGACVLVALIGCESISRPYVMKMDRVDQDMEIGNRGYLQGTPPPPRDRGELKRPFIAIDIDLLETKKARYAAQEEPRTPQQGQVEAAGEPPYQAPKEEAIK